MPELPEVETIVRGLQPLVGSRVTSVDYSKIKGLLKNDKPEALTLLNGWTLTSVARRGKWIQFIWNLDGNYLTQSVASHLGMFGAWLINGSSDRHSRLTLGMNGPQGEVSLTYSDMRSWGRLYIGSLKWIQDTLSHVAPDPFQMEYSTFKGLMRKRVDPIVEALLDQSLVSGIGNIYRSEILNAAFMAPDRPCTDLDDLELANLYLCIRHVLSTAIVMHGSSISDYRDTEGLAGSYQNLLKVYGRHGKPCEFCKTLIVKSTRWDRSVFYCPSCQK